MAKKAKHGGKRKGAGRKTMFEGPRVKLGVKITVACQAMIDETRARLEPEHGSAATVASALEYLVRKGYGRKASKGRKSDG